MHLMKQSVAALLFALSGVAPTSHAAWPEKPVRIIVPFAPGGSADILARTVSNKLNAALGQPVIVENRAGAAGNIGTELVAKSKPDGYTLLVGLMNTHVVNHALYEKLPFDGVADFTPIAMLASVITTMAIHPSVPAKNVKEFIAVAKSRPDQLAYASAGAGSSTHLNAAVFEKMAGIRMLHVPYKGGAPAITATAGGEVPAGKAALGSAMPHIKSGRVRVLAVTTGTRSFVDKSWPTLIESGVPEVRSSIWAGLFAPKGVPQPIIEKLYAEIAKILELPEVKERFAAGGGVPGGMRPEAFGDAIRKEAASLKKVAVTANVKPE
jgi:tripartite-type tricarboxylate transporter receptor subunit TctC